MLADNGVPPDRIALHLLDAHRCGDAAVIGGSGLRRSPAPPAEALPGPQQRVCGTR
jgi:hypothetical protein